MIVLRLLRDLWKLVMFTHCDHCKCVRHRSRTFRHGIGAAVCETYIVCCYRCGVKYMYEE